jgi:hypothetical protein
MYLLQSRPFKTPIQQIMKLVMNSNFQNHEYPVQTFIQLISCVLSCSVAKGNRTVNSETPAKMLSYTYANVPYPVKDARKHQSLQLFQTSRRTRVS